MEGLRTCTGCGQALPVEEFAWKDRRSGRRQPRCPPCHRQARREAYHRIPAAQRASVAKGKRRRRRRNQAIVAQAKDRACADCQQRFPPGEMDFDHVRGAKSANIADVVAHWSVQRLLTEIGKCEVVCANCHRQRTARRRRGD